MQTNVLIKAAPYTKQNRLRRAWRKLVRVMACIVVFCTTYAMILPAITKENKLHCGLDEHTHQERCYATASVQSLVCQVPEGHSHTDGCYETAVHTHDDGCYGAGRGALLCGLQEQPGHVHGEECFDQVLTCMIAEGHIHGDGCWKETRACTESVSSGHIHGPECMRVVRTLVCALPEGHSHSEGCFTRQCVCTIPEAPGHTHGDDCFAREQVLKCGLEQGERKLICTEPTEGSHIHSEDCFRREFTGEKQLVCAVREHEHSLSCRSDPNADLENAADWERSMASAKLTGVWDQDVVAIARTQLGYRESSLNYRVLSDGLTMRGYTRYGAWYGDPYGDWCAMFASFCLKYAGVRMPLGSNVDQWIAELSAPEVDLYRTQGDHAPQPGQLIFFDWDGDGSCNHVGIVDSVLFREDGSVPTIRTIEGNAGNQVRAKTYSMDNSTILGYGVLPEQTVYVCGMEEHSHDEFCQEEPCSLQEHTHTTTCLTAPVYYCGKAAHIHNDNCQDGEGTLNCGLEAHEHNDACLEISAGYYCGKASHVHNAACIDANGTVVCGLMVHCHSAVCTEQPRWYCGDASHPHTILCRADLGGLDEQAQADVAYAIRLIDTLPTDEEISIQSEAFAQDGNEAAEEAWLTQIHEWIREVRLDYLILHESLRPYVVNEERLLELEHIWIAQTYKTAFWSDVTTVPSVSTKDFIDLNLYDYTEGINTNFYNTSYQLNHYNASGNLGTTSKYPGFQWNGGAYMYTSTFHRHQVDYIDFGNSLITDISYGSSTIRTNGKSKNAVSVGRTKPTSASIIAKNKAAGYINELDVTSYGVTNRPIGISLNAWGDAASRNNAVLAPILTPNGYPALTADIGGGTLAYLFGGDTTSYVQKQNTASIDGLFQLNPISGAYFYNSRENHAQYSSNQFTLYKEVITPNFLVYPFGNFLPFNSINDPQTSTDLSLVTAGNLRYYLGENIISQLSDSDSSESQLKAMLGKYRTSLVNTTVTGGTAWSQWSALNAIQDYFWGDGGTNDDTPSPHTNPIAERINKGMYNVDFDEKTNFFFGMEMTMDLLMPKNGLAGEDNGNNAANQWATKPDGTRYLTGSPDGILDYPMVFEFSGDDDVWVYLDGNLFLDLSGIHRHVGGRIDFKAGQVEYYHLDVENTGDVVATPYQTFTFTDIVREALRYRLRNSNPTEAMITQELNKIINPATGTFYDYSTHKFKFFYMERGSGSSVCRMNFNFPILRKNSISVAKELTSNTGVEMVGAPDFSFQIMKANADGTKTTTPFFGAGVQYSIYNTDTNELIGTGTTGNYGVFKIKAGQRAEFTGIQESQGKYYVRELLDKRFETQYETYYVDGVVTDLSQDVYDPDTKEHFWGLTSPVKDISTGTSVFNFNNHVDAAKLSYLTITKMVDGISTDVAKTLEFDMMVELNGVLNSTDGWMPIPVGTPYTLYDTDAFIDSGGKNKVKIADRPDRVVTEAGIVTVPGGATAEIDYMIPGTTYRVYETSSSAEGYTVGYGEFWGKEWITAYDDRVEGTIPVYNESNLATAHVCMTVTNTVPSGSVAIPFSKTLSNGAEDPDRTHTYSFTIKLESAKDYASGYVYIEGEHYAPYSQTEEIQVTGSNLTNSNFIISYSAADFSTGKTTILTYSIKEDEPDALESTHDPTEYTAVVVVTKTSNGTLSPAPYLYSLEKNGEPVSTAAFTNTLLGDLTLEKRVEGDAAVQQNGSFVFTVQFGKSAATPLANTAIRISRNGGAAQTVTTDGSGIITLTDVKHGDKIVMRGMPPGTVWRITEQPVENFAASWTSTGGSGSSNVATGDIPPSGMNVVFTNIYEYVLPETGGMSITLFYALSSVMVLAAVVLLAVKKRMTA